MIGNLDDLDAPISYQDAEGKEVPMSMTVNVSTAATLNATLKESDYIKSFFAVE